MTDLAQGRGQSFGSERCLKRQELIEKSLTECGNLPEGVEAGEASEVIAKNCEGSSSGLLQQYQTLALFVMVTKKE